MLATSEIRGEFGFAFCNLNYVRRWHWRTTCGRQERRHVEAGKALLTSVTELLIYCILKKPKLATKIKGK